MKRYGAVILFIILFISIISIIAILIARGYNFTGNEIKENGILSISSNPQGSTIFINGEKRSTTPENIELISGIYQVELTLDNYISWKKDIFVDPLITKNIYATLYPKELELEQMTFSNVDYASFSEDGDMALYTILEEPNSGIWLMKLEKSVFDLSSSQPKKISNIEAFKEQCLQKNNYSIQIAPSNDAAILKCKEDPFDFFYLISINQPNTPPLLINEALHFTPTSLTFGFDSLSFIVQDETIIAHFNAQTGQIQLITRKTNGNEVITPFGSNTFLLFETSFDNKEKHIIRLTKDLQREILPIEEPLLENTISISGSRDNETLFAMSTETGTSIYNTQTKTLQEIAPYPITVKSWAPDGKAFLFTENNQLFSIEIRYLPDKSYECTSHTIITKYTPENLQIRWTHHAQRILSYNTQSAQLSSIDLHGENSTVLYKGMITKNNTFSLSITETFLVVLLPDDTNTSNLYSIKLKV